MIVFKVGDMVYMKSNEEIHGTCSHRLGLLDSLYEYVKEEYFDEINRKARNDQKAFSLAALFVTILGIVLGTPVLGNVNVRSVPTPIIVFYFITLVCFVAGLLCVSVSFMMITIEGRPDPKSTIDHFGNSKNENTEEALLQFLIIRTRDACQRFRNNNLQRIKRMNCAFVLLLIGMASLVITVVLVVYLIPKG